MNSGISLFLQVLFVALAASGVYSFVASMKEGEQRRICTPVCSLRPDYAGDNRIAPDFELPNLQGEKVRLSDYRGKVVILNFWTKTCAPCLREMPSLSQLARVLEAHPNIQLLTITTDESAQDASATLASVLGEAAPFETLVDAESATVTEKYGSKLFPETWFIDPEGVIRARVDGPRDWYELAPLSIEFAKIISGPLRCDVTFDQRKTAGNQCEGIPGSG
jgi:peroxiredoxin